MAELRHTCYEPSVYIATIGSRVKCSRAVPGSGYAPEQANLWSAMPMPDHFYPPTHKLPEYKCSEYKYSYTGTQVYMRVWLAMYSTVPGAVLYYWYRAKAQLPLG